MSTNVQNPLYISAARDSANSQTCMAVYDKWAPTYNEEVGSSANNYMAPQLAAQLAIRTEQDLRTALILDAGCGTGLVGQAFAAAGARTIDGFDLSGPMLQIAEQTGVYRNLMQADMNQPLAKPDNAYDLVTCVGTFTTGHVGPKPALRELLRITKNGGILVVTVLEEIWVEAGFKSEVELLMHEGAATLVAASPLDYVSHDKAIYVVVKKS